MSYVGNGRHLLKEKKRKKEKDLLLETEDFKKEKKHYSHYKSLLYNISSIGPFPSSKLI